MNQEKEIYKAYLRQWKRETDKVTKKTKWKVYNKWTVRFYKFYFWLSMAVLVTLGVLFFIYVYPLISPYLNDLINKPELRTELITQIKELIK